MTEDFNLKRVAYQSGGKELEFLIQIPEGSGPFPVVVYLHGHNRLGAWEGLMISYFLCKAGFVAVLPSQVGFGLNAEPSDRDFCGPMTVNGIVDCLDALRQFEYVDMNKIGVWGISRGAIVASQLITIVPEKIKAAVLQSGVYDVKKDYDWELKESEIKHNMDVETNNGGDSAWAERSCILNLDKVSTPILVLHGESDNTVNVEQAKLLDNRLTELQKVHQTVVLKALGHDISFATRRIHTFPFLEKHLK